MVDPKENHWYYSGIDGGWRCKRHLMYRLIAKLLSAGIGGAAAWQVYINLDQIFTKWTVVLSATVIVFIVVTLLFYLPLLKHVADMIQDRLSTINQRFRATRTGLNLDEIPRHTDSSKRRMSTGSHSLKCGICGGPGGPVCESCHKKMSTK